MMISLGVFFKILLFDFLGRWEGQSTKMALNDKKKHCPKIMSIALHISETIHHMIVMCKRIISAGVFYIFTKFWFSLSIVG